MGTLSDDKWDGEYSEVRDKGDVGFLEFEDNNSIKGFDPLDEGPIVISLPFPFVNRKPRSVLIGEICVDSITIQNTTCDAVDLWGIRIFSSNPEDSFTLSLIRPPSSGADLEAVEDFLETTTLEDRVLCPGETLTVWLSCKPKEIGLHTSVVHFDLGDEKIERVAFLLAEDKVSQALFTNKPYCRASNQRKKFVVDSYISGQRPPRQNRQGFRYSLLPYPIPKQERELIESKQTPEVIMEGLNIRNYAKYFSTLIIMEEIGLEEDMRAHDMECVSMKKRGSHFLSLEVPGLAERRPSLVYGDYIFAKLVTSERDDCSPPYQGYIHRVEADEIFLRFNGELHQEHHDNYLYNVSFTYNRLNMRRLYQAIQAAAKLGPELLFPTHSSQTREIKKAPFVPLNAYLNQEQVRCVEMILGCKGVPPYVIHGPPGTGKTVTLVEAILQLYRTRPKTRILVCASSNSAADHVLEKLLDKEKIDVREDEIFRLNATSRSYEDINPDFLPFCFFEDMVFKCPPLRALLRCRIIVSTYMSASLLYAEGISSNHFTHIFLDEAGQASEPETMIPLSHLCTRETVIVLAGDPMQLGPVVCSRSAESFGLGKSYLERLFECGCYKDGNENFLTKLVRNYRCHPAILELPSKLFYDSQLISCKEDNEPFDWDDLPNKDFPILFFGIQGCDEREGSNPSWFNRFEASKVVETIKKLYESMELTEFDIGVITPYRQQVLKLKKALETLDMPNVKVGSVEQFQGQEKEVIVISTVRSTVIHNGFDRVHNLGFLSNPRRFNVAVTRAKSLLVIVGNPHIIAKDRNWDKLLRYCETNGSYRGCPLPQPEWHLYDDELAAVNGDDNSHVFNRAEGGEDVHNQNTSGVEYGEDLHNQASGRVEMAEERGESSSKMQSSFGRDDDISWSNLNRDGWTENDDCCDQKFDKSNSNYGWGD